jgi:uncharacterized protein (TIRG00374 family)
VKRRRRDRIVLVLRIVISIAMLGLLAWQLPDFEPGELIPQWTPAVLWWLLASTATMVFAFALQTLRWDTVLVPMGYHVPFRHLFSEFLAGQFVSNVLPTAFAGDVVRIARLRRDIGDGPAAFASIALERLTGWVVLPTISLIAIAWEPAYRSLGAATVVALVVDVVTLVALVAVLLIAANKRWQRHAVAATGWRKWIAAIHLGITAIRRRPTAVASIAFAGLAFQITQCLSIWMAAKALDIDEVTVLAAFAFFPPTLISQNLPVGFGGLGVREGGFLLFFGALGATDERAIALGLVTYLITVVASSFGAPFLAIGGQRWSEALVEAEQAAEEPLDIPPELPDPDQVRPEAQLPPVGPGDTDSAPSAS